MVRPLAGGVRPCSRREPHHGGATGGVRIAGVVQHYPRFRLVRDKRIEERGTPSTGIHLVISPDDLERGDGYPEIGRLRGHLTPAYALLDPLLPREGKFLALDLYDTWFLLTGAHVAPADLVAAVEARRVFRGKTIQEVRGAFRAKEARYRRLWEPRLAPRMVELPPFEVVCCGVARSWRRAGAIRCGLSS